ncbi:MAG: hypothetical protein K2H03_09665 [Muribaculaceae bacterium]|nr:hypothetical protein [Muribaculaceae bacterium]MDE5930734.1 hypothetical protein [Muribaculaceae bacterium]
MTSYFPFGHIIADYGASETRHPYIAVWDVSAGEPADTKAEEVQISEIYY